METVRFKTDIKCSGCVAKVSPFLNEAFGEGNWQVDTLNPSKVLTVQATGKEERIEEVVAKAGYKAERL